MIKNKVCKKLCFLIQTIEGYIKDSSCIPSDLDSLDDLKANLEKYKGQINRGDFSSLEALKILFAPTGTLQELSIVNSWGDEYLELASRFDGLAKQIKFYCFLKDIYSNFLELFFPSTCIVCSNRLHTSEQSICLSCLNALPKTNYHNQPENRLENFLGGKFPFERAAAFCYFYKTGSLQKIIHEFKYRSNPGLAALMGRLYGNDLKNSDFLKGIDYLIPIPLHPKKLKQRGYNQAEEICKGISEVTAIPISSSCIQRVINNPSQTKRTRTERWDNTDGIFALTEVSTLENKHILLVDDVITTGSTLEAIMKILPSNRHITVSIASVGMAM